MSHDADADDAAPSWIGRWVLARHAALYDDMFFNVDPYELREFARSADFDARVDDRDTVDPNEIVAQIHASPDEALGRWSEALVIRSDLDLDPYAPPSHEFDEELLLIELGSKHGLLQDDILKILGRSHGRAFVYFTPDAATQRAVREEYRARRLAALEGPGGPVHSYGAHLSSLRYAWLELRGDGSFVAVGSFNCDRVEGRWRDQGDERLALTPSDRWLAERLKSVEYLGDRLSITMRSSDSIEAFDFRREPPIPERDRVTEDDAPGLVSAAQWWNYLRAAPRVAPPTNPRRSRGRKRPAERLVLRPEPSWLRTPIDYLALREGPWAPATVELDLCALELDTEEDIKRVLGALSWPRAPWASLKRIRVPEGFLLDELAPFVAASATFAGARVVEHLE